MAPRRRGAGENLGWGAGSLGCGPGERWVARSAEWIRRTVVRRAQVWYRSRIARSRDLGWRHGAAESSSLRFGNAGRGTCRETWMVRRAAECCALKAGCSGELQLVDVARRSTAAHGGGRCRVRTSLAEVRSPARRCPVSAADDDSVGHGKLRTSAGPPHHRGACDDVDLLEGLPDRETPHRRGAWQGDEPAHGWLATAGGTVAGRGYVAYQLETARPAWEARQGGRPISAITRHSRAPV